jgi:Uma2 family endonuclease
MATSARIKRKPDVPVAAVDPTPILRQIAELTDKLPTSDGVPLETPWHVASISLLIQSLTYLWRDREDFFVGGNNFIYYSARQRFAEDFRGPDFYYVSGVERRRWRDCWAVWMEGGKYPDLIVEFLSPSTAANDRGPKKTLYEQTFRTAEYFCYEPKTWRLDGWRLNGQRYKKIRPDKRGWLWSEMFQLWLGSWQGTFHDVHATWLRCYDAQGQLVLLESEAEHQRAEAERQRAEAEHQRAEAAEAELARLKASRAKKRIPPDTAR